MADHYLPPFLDLLAKGGQYRQALEVSEVLLLRLAGTKILNKCKIRTVTIQIQEYCRRQLKYEKVENVLPQKVVRRPSPSKNKASDRPAAELAHQEKRENKARVLNIPVAITLDDASFQIPLSSGRFMSYAQYELAMQGHALLKNASLSSLTHFGEIYETSVKVIKNSCHYHYYLHSNDRN